MFLFEWLMEKGKANLDLQAMKDRHANDASARLSGPSLWMSSSANDNDSVYAFDETCIDVRTANDEKRGVISLATLGCGGILLWGGGGGAASMLIHMVTGQGPNGIPFGTDGYIAGIVVVTTFLIAACLFIKYVGPYMRLELFTARRIVVRFNRITRRVYLLRPKHCGGIVSMDWDRTEVALDRNLRGGEGMGGFIYMGWLGDAVGVRPDGTTTDHEATLVGKPTRNAEELLAFWEYIRRYMEEGPQAVPPPRRLLPKFPSPWHSFRAVWGLDTGFLGDARLWIFVLLRLMLLPAIVLHALGHWVSLLLCYEPKFPKDIENAGR